jgi:hypothetical protein
VFTARKWKNPHFIVWRNILLLSYLNAPNLMTSLLPKLLWICVSLIITRISHNHHNSVNKQNSIYTTFWENSLFGDQSDSGTRRSLMRSNANEPIDPHLPDINFINTIMKTYAMRQSFSKISLLVNSGQHLI